jgi:hypothetical protein
MISSENVLIRARRFQLRCSVERDEDDLVVYVWDLAGGGSVGDQS